MRPRLNGGFPLAYLFDKPGISVEGRLSFVEDEFRTKPFALDLGAFLAVFLLCALAVGRCKRSRRLA